MLCGHLTSNTYKHPQAPPSARKDKTVTMEASLQVALNLTAPVEAVAAQEFDYVIAGGGTAGLVLAARLTEDPNVTVCVLEAGSDNLNEPEILIPHRMNIGNPKIDWGFKTVPQLYADNQVAPWSRGKGLGGSSALNMCLYQRPSAFDIDAIGRLGNPGWNWDRFLEYAKKSETFQLPTPEEAEKHHFYTNPEYHGTNGPLRAGFRSTSAECSLLFQKTLNNLDIEVQKDHMGGKPCGTWVDPATIDKETGSRSYAANAYYAPNISRKNLTVLIGALVHKVTFSSTRSNEDVQATGVAFTYDGKNFEVKARKEVIVSAGALKSPQILELSGVGDPKVLKPLGIDVHVELPGVGENLQEHNAVVITFELTDSDRWVTRDAVQFNPELAAEHLALYRSTGEGLYSMSRGIIAFSPLKTLNPKAAEDMIASIEAKIQEQKDPALREQWALQLDAMKNDDVPDCELLGSPNYVPAAHPPNIKKKYFTVCGIHNRTLSRGTIHITSTNPVNHADIDPHSLEQDEDMVMILEIMKFIRKLPETEPFKGMVAKELNPGPECVTDQDMRTYIKKYLRTSWHTAGTCSMLPRDKGGVVDSRLKVYGTTNVRVVDLSVIPLHIMAHTQATVYALAEQAADIIKGVI
ncbi:hypothetical protein BOTBODRAFT_27544 [Botryobasidium botryosum FD-172 SS1]|uniref:Glucose-methanol-choline oxidoreductase N-terminal domain-containing protein n=1 Tax=Botryobasidium botryosum (strain FD-172 SS1) TaxID=930990 RepID=A0A067MZJ8_BOTB1|nr:hypothetical protein BOTBODRAFT_27544 [Botryobasidium botryosum FD-172 SS1]